MITPPPAAWLDAEGDALLAFARGAATALGFGTLDDAGTVPDPARAELWITCRMTHVFALAALRGRPGDRRAGRPRRRGPDHHLRRRRARRLVHRRRAGPGRAAPGGGGGRTQGGLPARLRAPRRRLGDGGRPARAPRSSWRGRCAVSTERFWDDEAGMVRESFDRAFTEPEDYRGVNANMHTVEAYLAVADVTGEDLWLDRALRITRRVIDGEARAHGWRLPEHFTPGWRPLLEYHRDQPAHPFRPFGATIGHWLEWARLTLAAARRARGARARPRGVDARGAAGAGRRPPRARGGRSTARTASSTPWTSPAPRWCASACTGWCARRSGPPRRCTPPPARRPTPHWYRTWWDYARRHLIEAPGRWHHELAPDNTPAAGTWSGRPDVYHAYQATLLPRLPLAPALAPALAAGLLEA